MEHHLAALATTQYGVVSRRQLEAIGFGRGAIARRLQSGRLQRLHGGVYAVGHRALVRHAYWTAAVLASGAGAVLSDRACAALLELRAHTGSSIEVTVAHPHARGGAGVRVHRRALEPWEVTSHLGIPCTSVARTLLDLGALGQREVERACDQAEVHGVFDLRAIEEILARRAGARGAGVLRRVVERHAIGTTITRNDLEEAFYLVCRRADVPRPEVNAPVLGRSGVSYEADFLWRAHRLVVETDGRAVHATRTAFESDRRRDADLVAAGYRVVRFTWRQVMREPEAVAWTLAGLFEADSARASDSAPR